MLKRFNVSIKITGYDEIEVGANTDSEAQDLALDMIDPDKIQFEIEVLDVIEGDEYDPND